MVMLPNSVPGLSQPLLINILGHTAGALIFAIFLWLLYSDRGWSGARGRRLSGWAAGLSLAWNLGSLVVLICPALPLRILNSVVALSFSFLSLLPAVLLHLSAGGRRRVLVGSGYGLSGVAVVMHFWEVHGNDPALHQQALLLITFGFVLLTAVAVAGALRPTAGRRTGGARIAGSMCLALFATSFVHFGAGHASQVWSSELLIHHAGIPLALLVLLQEDRFVLLDAFVRFLANALLAAALAWLAIESAFRLALIDRAARNPLAGAVLFIGICLFLVLFAWLRNRVQRWLTHAVFRQGSLADLPDRLKDAPPFDMEDQYLDWAAATMAEAVRSKKWSVVAPPATASAETYASDTGVARPSLEGADQTAWAEAVVPLRLGEGGSKLILLGRRQGGQRFLGEDLDSLARAATEIGSRVDSLRREEMQRLVTQAELRALQSQINPHFLFNALNTVYGSIPREAVAARRIVLNLADIFRYFLQSNKTFVPLSEELEIVRAYLNVEQVRLGDRLRAEIDVDDAVLMRPIPVLSIQPLVENAIRHGVARCTEPGYVRLRAIIDGDAVQITVENSAAPGSSERSGAGMALCNVRRRLEICYGSASTLRLDYQPHSTIAQLTIPQTSVAAR